MSAVLDSSLKKNTAFIKKARLALNAENLPSMKSDIETLSLEKYLSEVVSAMAEGLGRVKLGTDVAAAIEVVSLLHQRFAASFTTVFAFQLVRALAPPPASYLASLSPEQKDKDEASRISRQRNLYKIVTDLWLVGVFRSIQDAIDGSNTDSRRRKMDEALPVFCLRELLANDKDFSNLSIATTFVKSFPELISSDLGGLNTKPPHADRFRPILLKYCEGLAIHLQRQNDVLNREKARLEDATVNFGAAPAAREGSIAELGKLQEKQIVLAQILTDGLGQAALVLRKTEDTASLESSIICGFGKSKKDGSLDNDDDKWDDEDQRRFYEVLLDLTQVVPSDMLQEDSATPQTLPTEKGLESESAYSDEEEPFDVPEEEFDVASTSIGIKVNNLLLRLSEMTNRELVDTIAVEFALLNSKASRNRLTRVLLGISSNRSDLLPYYARLIATLSQHSPSIAVAMVSGLHRDCRKYTMSKGLNKDLSKRLLNIRFLSELVKFRVVPHHVIFHCLKITVEHFTKPDAEVLACLLEHCGRFLLRTESTSTRMQTFLEVLMRKARHTSGVERTLIENAFYYVNPPEQASIPQKERSIYDKYIDKLVYEELANKTLDKVLRQLKKLDWSNEGVVRHLISVFTKIWKVNFSSIPLLAVLLSNLGRLHSHFVIRVVDTVIENIRLGFEANRFRENQMRIAMMKYLGEMYNYKIVDGNVVFETLYMTLCFGNPERRPVIGGLATDPAEDFFRVRLVLALLDSTGTLLSPKSLQSRLDVYLCFFQYYLKSKATAPVDIDFAIRQTFANLRPGLLLCSTLEEAASELDEAVKNSLNRYGPELLQSDDDSQSTASDTKLAAQDDDNSSFEGALLEQGDASDDSSEEPEFVLLEKKREQDDLDRLAEDELEREFSKIMVESFEARKPELKKSLNIMLPRRQAAQAEKSEISVTGPRDMISVSHKNRDDFKSDDVSFTFLSRKSKPRSLNLPSTSPFAINNAAHRIAEEQEKQTIRDLTLMYEGAQSREEIVDTPAKPLGIK